MVTSEVPVNAIRGARNPLSFAVTSKAADAFGVCVPTPNCANNDKVEQTKISVNTIFFIAFFLKTILV